MLRTVRSKVSPWIEALILSYGLEQEEEEEDGGGGGLGRGGDRGHLQAHVIGVGQMTQSQQAHASEGPTGLLFLSDGVLQIPAVLTTAAWEKLQEQEDRECFTSLLNTTVCIQDYQLQFHMAPEQTRCRFFLSVGELVTTSAGPVKHSPPYCTVMPSVRTKICRTWRALQGQEESQRSQQWGFDLSELLGEWQYDCLQSVLQDVRKRLLTGSPQPSTSAYRPPSTYVATGWDVDRVTYKDEEGFSVPVNCLLIREAEQLQTDAVGRNSPKLSKPSVEESVWWMTESAAVEPVCDSSESSPLPEDNEMHEDRLAAMIDIPPFNPWNKFPPPCVTSESSSDATPPNEHTPSESNSAAIAMTTSTQIHSSTFIPPYQKQLISPTAITSVSDRPPPSADQHHTSAQQAGEQAEATQHRKRRQSGVSPEMETSAEQEEELVSGSPPSWLFITQSRESEGECSSVVPKQKKLRTSPNTHSDGTQFSYSYRAIGQNLQDFSGFRVADSLLQWAVKYLLLPKKKDDPPNVL
ncbi:adrenocortical dysplasia protein homolog [Gouania willdenowi]|uniref:adrenocortical dysplasia protein homolog n=1 Tax=Gouania willdenowi TaxID=441366 RepID=UPI0010545158|nr:uncharacterized protein LOC114465389 [Gouania willdenowi]